MKIDYANLNRQTARYRAEIDLAIKQVIDSGAFILGPVVEKLELELSNYIGCKSSISCGSGTDALSLALMALDIQPGDEVITSPFTFIASAETIAYLKAKPVFVDIDEHSFNISAAQIESAITERTKAIMPICLYGQVADMDEINAIADKYQLPVIEDAAQSFGATYKDRKSGNLSQVGCTSFFPAKPLGCFGDGGAVFTNDDALAEKIKSLRVHGQTKRYFHEHIGMGGRMDAVQAAILSVKLKYYQQDLQKRQHVAKTYQELLQNCKHIQLPQVESDRTSAWAQFSIRLLKHKRSEVQAALQAKGIPTAVHYPMPLHKQPCFKYLNHSETDFPIASMISTQIMSIPLNPDMTIEEIEYVASCLLEVCD